MEQCLHHHQHHHGQPHRRLEGIEEEGPDSLLPMSVRPPETPTETMEFLARSWSLSAVEISKALKVLGGKDTSETTSGTPAAATTAEEQRAPPPPPENVHHHEPLLQRGNVSAPQEGETVPISPPISPRANLDVKLLRAAGRGKTMGAWMKEQKEKKRAEARSRNAQVYAATSVAGVAAAVASVVAGAVFSPPDRSRGGGGVKTAAAIASAAALVASHCVEMAQMIGAGHDQILSVIHSAVNAQTSGDIMALTAGAATALRGATMLRARLNKEIQATALTAENPESERDLSPWVFVSRGCELLKRTRKGMLHWKLVTVYINYSFQVVVKMKSTHMAGTFTKTKKCLVLDVCSEIPAWAGRELDDESNQRAYFGIKTVERVIEFECRSKYYKYMWVQGIREMLKRRENMNVIM